VIDVGADHMDTEESVSGTAHSPVTDVATARQGRDPASKPMSGATTIAIDGPAASGKSTIARAVAQRLNRLYLDTGAMYRAVTWLALRAGIDPADEAAVSTLAAEAMFDFPARGMAAHVNPPIIINDVDATDGVRDPAVDAVVSGVAAYPGVRAALVREQQKIARARGVVMVGRDIGTVVLPDAPLKIYLVADAAARARRRYDERIARGEGADYDEIYGAMVRRDHLDSARAHSPLRPAPDAVELDTTGLTIPEVVDRVLALARERAVGG
jgi:cytidylate kinase